MSYRIWKSLDKEKIYSTPIFDISKVRKEEEQTNKVSSFFQVDAPNWATVIPFFINENNIPCFLMEKQYRHGEEKVTIEYIAGMVEKGENPLDGAKREFREETGFQNGDFTLIGKVSPNSAFMTNYLYVYLVENFTIKGERNLDENESIELVEIPVEKVLNNMGEDEYSNGIMSIATFFYLKYKKLI